jgi:hypothetical protein
MYFFYTNNIIKVIKNNICKIIDIDYNINNLIMSSFQGLFTPIFIISALCIFIAGIVGLQVLDRLFEGSKNLSMIRLFCISIIINIIILIFLIMSFNKVTFQIGPQGPSGNKGVKGNMGAPGGLQVCGNKYQTVQEKKTFEKSQNYLDLKPPLLSDS